MKRYKLSELYNRHAKANYYKSKWDSVYRVTQDTFHYMISRFDKKKKHWCKYADLVSQDHLLGLLLELEPITEADAFIEIM